MFLIAPALMVAQESSPPATAKRKISASSFLPGGSILSGVMLPRYDQNRHLLGVLRAKTMILVDANVLEGRSVSIELFNPDRSQRGRIDFRQASYDQTIGCLRSRETVTINFGRVATTGSSLVSAFTQAEGFLSGPVTSWIKATPKTAMTPSPRSTTALLGASLLALPISTTTAQDPAGGTSPPIAADIDAGSQTRSNLRSALEASAEATRAATAYLDQEDLLAKAPPVPEAVVQSKPLDVKPDLKTDTVIDCDGGMYFDSDKGVLAYLQNVTVSDPRFTLDGANDLKVFFEKKPEDPESRPKPGDNPVPGGMQTNIGDVERIVATGAVHIKQIPKPGEDAIEAAGAIFTYHFKSGEIVLSGGQPWVRKGGIITQAKQAEQTIRIINGEFSFSPGGNRTILPTNNLEPKPR